MSINPRTILQCEVPIIKVGHKADITLFDPEKNGHTIEKITILKVKILLFLVPTKASVWDNSWNKLS